MAAEEGGDDRGCRLGRGHPLHNLRDQPDDGGARDGTLAVEEGAEQPGRTARSTARRVALLEQRVQRPESAA